jgi:hypothetical protein
MGSSHVELFSCFFILHMCNGLSACSQNLAKNDLVFTCLIKFSDSGFLVVAEFLALVMLAVMDMVSAGVAAHHAPEKDPQDQMPSRYDLLG